MKEAHTGPNMDPGVRPNLANPAQNDITSMSKRWARCVHPRMHHGHFPCTATPLTRTGGATTEVGTDNYPAIYLWVNQRILRVGRSSPKLQSTHGELRGVWMRDFEELGGQQAKEYVMSLVRRTHWQLNMNRSNKIDNIGPHLNNDKCFWRRNASLRYRRRENHSPQVSLKTSVKCLQKC